ncbi:MAG: hypothetical protein Q9199_002390 [Rusavskia elegans]
MPGDVRGYFEDDPQAPAGIQGRPSDERCTWENLGLDYHTAVNQDNPTQERSSAIVSTQNDHPAYGQQPSNQGTVPDRDASETEQDELERLETEASEAQRALDQAKRVAKQAQKNLDDAYLRIQQRMQATHNHHASTQQATMVSYTGYAPPREVTGFLPSVPPYPAHRITRSNGTNAFAPTPSSRKRSTDERDDDEDSLDADGQERRVRSKIDMGYPEAHVQSNASASRPTYRTGGSVPRRHEHPSQYIRASRSANRIWSSQPFVAINNMLGGMPSINTTTQPQESNSLRDEDFLNLDTSSSHFNSPLQTHADNLGNNFQSWADRSSFAVQQAFGSNLTGFRNTQTPALELTGPYLPTYHSLDSPGHPDMPRKSASGSLCGSSRRSMQPTQDTTTSKPNPKKRPRASKNSTGDETVNEDDDNGEPPRKIKRQVNRQRLEAKGIELPKDTEKPMGKVYQDRAGNIYVIIDGKAEYAAFHNQRRLSLLAREDAKGRYRYPLERGLYEDDRKAFHQDYANINLANRHARPDLLFQWNGPKKGRFEHPGFMRDPDDGKVLLSNERHPILDWPELPKVLSSQVEGLLLEYWCRLNQRIKIEDIVARCPNKSRKNGSCGIQALQQSAYSNRKQEARLQNGTCAWQMKEGSREIRAAMESVMPQRVLDEKEQSNTTRSWRDLTKDESDAIKLANKGIGSARKRAGNRALSEKAKKEVDAIKNPKAAANLQRLHQEKAVDDARYARTRVNPGLLLPNPPTFQALQSTSLAPSQGIQQPVHPAHRVPLGPPHGIPQVTRAARQHFRNHRHSHARNGAETTKAFQQVADEGDTTLVVDHEQLDTINSGKIMREPEKNQDYNAAIRNTSMAPYQPADIRCLVPSVEEQRGTITKSLDITRKAYKTLTGKGAPMTDMLQSYMYQWNEIQQSVTDFYRQHGRGQKAPKLFQRPAWYFQWDGWTEQNVTDLPTVGNGLELLEATKRFSPPQDQEPAPSVTGNAAEVAEPGMLALTDLIHLSPSGNSASSSGAETNGSGFPPVSSKSNNILNWDPMADDPNKDAKNGETRESSGLDPAFWDQYDIALQGVDLEGFDFQAAFDELDRDAS